MSSFPITCTGVATAEANGSNSTSGEKMNCPGGIWPKVQHVFKMRLEPEAHRVHQELLHRAFTVQDSSPQATGLGRGMLTVE